MAEGNGLLDFAAWRDHAAGINWKSMLEEAALEEEVQNAIRRNTHAGHPLGSDSLLSKVEHRLGRRIRPLPMGRQEGWRKEKSTKAVGNENE